MANILLRQCSVRRLLSSFAGVTLAVLACVPISSAQSTTQIHRTFTLSTVEPLVLDVDISSGDLQIVYGRDGQVSLTGVAKAASDAKLDDTFFPSVLSMEQAGNHLTLRSVPNSAYPEEGVHFVYRIEVPYRTQLTSRLGQGKQNISGIMGPVMAVTSRGDIKASYISKGLQAQIDHGNVDLQVIGDHVEAKTGLGNISCARAEQGISAITGDGDITLMVVGSSTATVKKGNGRIDVGGARGRFTGSTDAGDLHVRAIPHDDWELNSTSGNVRLELPPFPKLALNASTETGEFQVERDDIAKPPANSRHLDQTLNGGTKRIDVHTESGSIVIR